MSKSQPDQKPVKWLSQHFAQRGFPKTSPVPKRRLLNDLNFDAMKPSDLVATALKQGGSGTINASTAKNMTLAEADLLAGDLLAGDRVAGLETAHFTPHPTARATPLNPSPPHASHAVAPLSAIDRRFIEQVSHFEPGVALVARAQLSLEQDFYINDHVWRGAYHFPTVFGLEAMAQAVACVMGEAQPSIVRMEEVTLRRPIVVHPTLGMAIEIHADVAETNVEGEQRIKVGIRTAQTGFITDHLSAVVVLGQWQAARQLGTHTLQTLDHPLAIKPSLDLYGSLLFQGALFQPIEAVFCLSQERSVLQTRARTAAALQETGVSIVQGGRLLLGDPFCRDALFQAIQLHHPQAVCVPVCIDRIIFFQNPSLSDGTRLVTTTLQHQVRQEYRCDVLATDATGTGVEQWQGYRVGVLEAQPQNPTASELAVPEQRDQHTLQKALTAASKQLGVCCPTVELGYAPGLRSQPQAQRRLVEQPLVARLLQRYGQMDNCQMDTDAAAIEFVINTLSSGKPQLSGAAVRGLDLSLSHDEHYCLCSVAETPQGCELEPIVPRSATEWDAIVSATQSAIVPALVQAGDDRDRARTRAWAALKAVRKACNETNPAFSPLLSVAERQGTAVLLQAKTAEATYWILTLSVTLTRCPERMVALVVERSNAQVPTSAEPSSPTETAVDSASGLAPSHHGERITADGPQAQPVYEQRFSVTFKESCSVSRKVTVSQYISWVGKMRELPLRSMAADLVPAFLQGEWDMVTNTVSLRVLGEATTYDTIQARCWVGNVLNSTFDTYIEFCKILPDETLERVALAEVRATWVQPVNDESSPDQPFPAYVQAYLDRFAPNVPAAIDLKHGLTTALPSLPARLANLNAGAMLYRAQTHYCGDLLLSEVFQTTLEESNLVGNIYYGSYFTWQGRMLDLFLYNTAPEYLRLPMAQGEMISLYSRIDFRQDAMPFDKIRGFLYVQSVSECGASFKFEFFRERSVRCKEKLHTGQQEVIWAERQPDGTLLAAPLPQSIRQVLMQRRPTESLYATNAF